MLGEHEPYTATKDLIKQSQGGSMVFLVFLALLILAGGGMFYYYTTTAPYVPADEEIQWGEEAPAQGVTQSETFSDSVLEAKVETTMASVKLFGGRMGSYDGACDDITVVDPIVCRHSDRAYVVFAPLSIGQYYCVDAQGFKGNVRRPGDLACK
jgi:hypothetical protein